jgi:hypothetical protein
MQGTTRFAKLSRARRRYILFPASIQYSTFKVTLSCGQLCQRSESHSWEYEHAASVFLFRYACQGQTRFKKMVNGKFFLGTDAKITSSYSCSNLIRSPKERAEAHGSAGTNTFLFPLKMRGTFWSYGEVAHHHFAQWLLVFACAFLYACDCMHSLTANTSAYAPALVSTSDTCMPLLPIYSLFLRLHILFIIF